MALRDLTQEEAQIAVTKGLDAGSLLIDNESSEFFEKPPQSLTEQTGEVGGRLARQAVMAAPSAIAGRLAATGAGSALGSFAGPVGTVAGGLAGGILGPIALRNWVQTPIEDQIVKRWPTSAIANQINKSRTDVITNPWQSLAGQLGTAPLAGGGFAVKEALKQGGKQIAGQAGIMTGVNVAGQVVGGGEIDIPQAVAGGVGGALLSKSGAGYRGFERGLLNKMRVPEGVIDAVAPNVKVNPKSSAMEAPPQRSQFPHEMPDYNPDFLLGTDVSNLAKLGKFEQAVGNLRKQNIPLGAEDLTTLSKQGPTMGWDKAVENLSRTKLPMLEGQAKPDARVQQQMDQDISPNKQASLSADAIKEADAATTERLNQANESNTKQLQEIQNAGAVKSAAEGLANHPTSGKPAATSAAAIMGREAEVKNVSKEMLALKSEGNTIASLEKFLKSLPEDTPNMQDLTSMINEMKGVYNTKKLELGKRAESMLPGGKGLQEFDFPAEADVASEVAPVSKVVTQPAAQASPAPAPIQPAAPAAPAQPKPIKAAPKNMSLTKETPIPDTMETINEQMKLLREGSKPAVLIVEGGKLPPLLQGEQATITRKGIFIHKGIPIETISRAIKEDKVGDLLGYGVGSKPAGAETAVVVEKPSGTPVQEVLASKETAPNVVKAAQQVAKPGDKISAKPAAQVVQQRTSDADTVATLMSSSSPVGKTARLALREEAGAINAQGDGFYDAVKKTAMSGGKLTEGDFFKSLSPEAQQAVVQRYIKMIEDEPSKPSKGMKIKTGSKEAGFTLNPAKMLEAVKPDLDKLNEKFGEIGKRFTKKYQQMIVERSQIEGPLHSHVQVAENGLSTAQRNLVDKYLYEINDTGSSSIVLTPELQQRAQMIQEISAETAKQKQKGPWVTEYDEKGNQVQRPFQERPGYMPQELKPEIKKKLQSGSADDIAPIRERMVQFLMEKKGVDRATAEKIFISKYLGGAFTTRQAVSPEFQGMRFAEGDGIPPEFRANVFDAVKHYINKHATDLAHHNTMEVDPVIGKALGLTDDGKGNAYPDMPEGINVESGYLLNPLSKAVFRDYVGMVMPEAQAFERWNRLANALAIQTPSQVRDIVGSYPIFQEVLHPSENRLLVAGLKDLFSPETRKAAIRAGAVRPTRNVAQASALDVNDAVNQIADLVQKGTGTEALNAGQRTFNYAVGKRLAAKRLAENDTEFLEKWGPHRWDEWPEDKLTDYIANRINQNIVGSYDAQSLPSWVTKGSGSGLKPWFSLSRWSIDRFNRWQKNVYEPAKKGNIMPLLQSVAGAVLSAGAINWLHENLLKRKPKELTWEEYLKLGGKDTAHTIFSKAALTGYGGILSDAALMASQLKGGEVPRGFNNLLLQSGENVITRAAQFMNELNAGNASLADFFTITGAALRDNIQIVRLFTPKEDTEGKREERLAERTGFAPKSSGFRPSVSNPFSTEQMYRAGDVNRIRRVNDKRLQQGREDAVPSSAMKNIGVYKFIQQAQGPEAVKKALVRDLTQDANNQQTYAKTYIRNAR